MDVPAVIKPGRYCYAANPDSLNYVGLPHARKWNPLDEDWKLPENWQEIIFNGLRERLQKYRSFKIFMDNILTRIIAAILQALHSGVLLEIGRASCRERV